MSNYVIVRPLRLGDGSVLNVAVFLPPGYHLSEVCLHTPDKILSLKVRTDYTSNK